jgi:hypothetical protein
VISRFQIEDLIFQDGSGVVFRAFDTETGKTVALRRFFPLGARGVGLKEDEQIAYNIALGRLTGLSHPALRSIICGGCDPVDGIPFIASEWIDGTVLEPIVEQGPLPADAAVLLLTHVLEVSELISQVLAEEAVWVDTSLNTIVLGDQESGRGFTLWICPLKWLGPQDASPGFESITTLTGKIMGWEGRAVNDQAGGGLGAWLNWLRAAAANTTLREARENLAAAIGSEPPPAVKQPVSPARRPPPPKSSKHVVLAGLGLCIIVAALGGWLVTRNRSMAEPPDFTIPSSEAESNAPLPETNDPAARSGRVFSPARSDLLIKEKGRPVMLEGRLANTGSSKSGKTTYLYFSGNAPAYEVRGALPAQNAAGFNAAPIIGKKIRITGKVRVVKGRPEIVIANQAAIQVVE